MQLTTRHLVSRMCKRSLILVPLLFAGTVMAAGPGGGTMSKDQMQSQTMTTQQANQQMMHQTMSPQSTEHMLQLMQQMRDHMTQMSQLMEKHQMMSQTNLSQAAKVMEHMSTNMQELSKRIRQGQFDDKSVAMLNQHNQEMTQMMNQLQQQLENKAK